MMKYISLFFIILFLAGCGGECKTAEDCPSKIAYQASCVDSECKYAPLPNMCGNMQCETGENECSCPQDCGQCTGRLGQYMVETCVNNECIPNVDPSLQNPIYDVNEARSAAGTFKIETVYNNPFNFKRDQFNIIVELIDPARGTTNHKIVSAILKGMVDKRTVQLVQEQIQRPIWENYPVEKKLILDMPTNQVEGQIQSPILELKIEYMIGGTSREATLQVRYRSELTYVKPNVQYPCPECDDGLSTTRDICGPQTNYFCVYEPVLGVCGNYICEAGENKCTCPQDCGPCVGSAGNYLNYACVKGECVGVVKSGVQVEENSIFDERRLGPIQLNNKYEFDNPFDIGEDKLKIIFSLYSIGDAGNLKIETIRLMEKNQLIAEKKVDKSLTTELTVEVPIASIMGVEEEKILTLGIWYAYDQNGQTRRGDFTKSLGKITLLKT
jgi:hypothetical protein